MNVGDLVTLSAYGKAVQRTKWVKPDDIGIVTNIKRLGYDQYTVTWSKSNFKAGWQWSWVKYFDRRDLKFVKMKKKEKQNEQDISPGV